MESRKKLKEAIEHAISTGQVMSHSGDKECANEVAAKNFQTLKQFFDDPACMASMTMDAMGLNRAIYGESEADLMGPGEYNMQGYGRSGDGATIIVRMHKAEAKLYASMIAFCTAMYQSQPSDQIPWMKDGEVIEGTVCDLDDILGKKKDE